MLLAAAVVSVLVPGGIPTAVAAAGAALLGTWVLAMGGICAMAGRMGRAWPMLLAGVLMVALLPSVAALPPPWPLLTGPLTAAWALGHDPEAAVVWTCTLLPLVVLLATWRTTCPETVFRRGSST